MKIKFLMTGLLGLTSAMAFAQKGEVSNAQEQYGKYQTLKGQKPMEKMAMESLTSAKTSIDKASVNEKTANLALTQALKGSIYGSMAIKDTVAATSTPLFTTAEEAMKKAKAAEGPDLKGDDKKAVDKLLADGNLLLAQYQLNKGIREYGDKKYDLAYKSFDYYRTILPDDTNAIYYTGLAAANAKMWDPAITNYEKLLTTNFSGKQRTYTDLSNFYLLKQTKADTASALKVLNDASAKYPNDANLNKRLIEFNLQMGKKEEVLSKIESTIANDPKNKTLYYYAGITYTNVSEEASKKADKEKDPAKQAALNKIKDDNLAKAVDMYKKALDIDPNYFEANLNLGYVLISPAIDLYNAANKLPVTKQKEYDAAIAKSNIMFEVAKPYLQKAVDLKPTSIDALTNLKTYYLGKKDMAHANDLKKQIDALSGK